MLILHLWSKSFFISTLMKTVAPCNVLHGTSNSILPQKLKQNIKAEVTSRPQHFIQQILCAGGSFQVPVTSTCAALKMESCLKGDSDCEEIVSTDNSEQAKKDLHLQQGVLSGGSEDKKHHSERGVSHPEIKGKGKRRRNELSASSDDAKPPKRVSPNYFVAVQIKDSQLVSAAVKIQEGILQASEVDISSTCINPAKFHITLMVMHLEDKEAVQKAEEALVRLETILVGKLKGREVTLDFKGLSAFGGGRVVFSPPQPCQGLDDLHLIAEEVSAQMKESGITSTDRNKSSFNPHLTLFKFKHDKHLFKQGIKKIQESLYAPFKEERLGSETLSSLQLCQMSRDGEEKDSYYVVNKEISWIRDKVVEET